MTQKSLKVTTCVDLQLNHAQIDPKSIGMDDNEYNDILLSQLSYGIYEVVNITPAAKRFYKAIMQSTKKRKHNVVRSELCWETMQKNQQ